MVLDKNVKFLQKNKVKVLYFIFLILFILVIFALRLIKYQLFEGNKYYRLSTSNILAKEQVKPLRGLFYDKNGIPITLNVYTHNLYLVPFMNKKELKRSIKKLKALGLYYNPQKYRKNQENLVKRNISQKIFLEITVNKEKYPFLFIKELPNRYYPYKDIFYYPIGYVSLITSDDLKNKNINKFYENEDYIGRAGLEKLYETELRGKKGLLFYFINALGNRVPILDEDINKVDLLKTLKYKEKKAINGKNIYLTLDLKLQAFVYNLLKDYSAAAIVMNIKNGEILSFVSSPAVDPNLFLRGISPQLWQMIANNEKNPLLDKVIQNFNPASTFKIFTAYCGVKLDVLHNIQPCTGQITLFNVVKHCWLRWGHGKENLIDAIRNSCNVYFYQVGAKVGIDNFYKIAKEIELEKKTGVEVYGEKTPLIPNKNIKMKLGIGDGRWYPSETLDIAIGQGILGISPIKMAQFIAFIANKGILVRPHLIKQIGDKKIVMTNAIIDNDSTHFNKILKGMYEVVNSPWGTGKRAHSKLITIAGKTGTMQIKKIKKYYKKMTPTQENIPYQIRDNGWFVSFAPYNNPQYVMVIFMEHVGAGGYLPAINSKKIWEYMVKEGIFEK